jgi:predicted outer membrane repeat protein
MTFLAITSVVLASLTPAAGAVGIYVDCTNDGYEDGTEEFPFNTLAEGVLAVAEAGTVFVAPCVYEGPGNVDIDPGDKRFTLLGTAGPDSTVVECGGSLRGLLFDDSQDSTMVVAGLTIQNGYAGVGGAVDCDGTAPRFVDCAFIGNGSSNGGGAVRCSQSDGASFVRCLFVDNVACWGGAVHVREMSSVRFTDVTFIGNSSTQEGGAIDVVKSAVVLTDVTFTGNTTVLRGGAYHASGTAVPSTSTFTGALFVDNGAPSGGAISLSDGLGTIDGCTFDGNSAAYGSAVYLNDDPDVTIERTIMASGLVGRPVHCGTAVPRIRHCCVFGNQGGDILCGDHDEVLYVDPRFCNAPAGDFTLFAHSECLPNNNPWGELLGAFGQGCVDSTPPPVPTGLAAEPEDQRVFLSWDPSPDSWLDYFILERDTSAVFGPFTASFDVPGTTFLDYPLENGREYFYRLRARDLAGNESEPCGTVSCVVAPRPPSAPASLAAVAGDGSVALRWRRSPESDVAHYAVYRGTVAGFEPGEAHATTPDTTHLDTEVENYVTYYYVVTAVDTADLESEPSNEAAAVPHGVPPPVTGLIAIPGDTSVTLVWDPMVPPAADHYVVYRDTTGTMHGPPVFFEDFELYAAGSPPTNPPWVSIAQTGTSIRVTDSIQHSGTRSLALADSSASGYLRMFQVLPDTLRGTEWIECFIRPGAGARAQELVQCEVIGEDGMGYQAAVWEVRDGYLSHWVPDVGPVAIAECSGDAWHHLVWELDCESDTYRITLDDQMVVAAAPFWREARYLDAIQFRTRAAEHGRLWLDDLLWAAGPVSVTSVVDTAFVDAPLESGRRYYYWVTVVDTFGVTGPPSEVVEVVPGSSWAGGDDASLSPSLSFCVPNPFRSGTEIAYAVPGPRERVILRVFDVGGRLVTTLVDGDRSGGLHWAVWDGRSAAGQEVASGVYFCRIEIGAWSSVRKMVLVR